MDNPLILAIDPGTERSGLVLYDSRNHTVLAAHKDVENREILGSLRAGSSANVLVIEDMGAQGMEVGNSTFITVRWTGRFQEAWDRHLLKPGKQPVHYLFRREVQVGMCGRTRYKNPLTGKTVGVGDSQIRRACIERFPATGGGKVPEIGLKKSPGPLFGVSTHAWQALGLALTWCQQNGIHHGPR